MMKLFQEYHSATPFEKVYLHTDKEVYTPGETLWFSAYVLNGTYHTFSTLSNVIHVELVSAQDSSIYKIALQAKNGTSDGDISLPDSIKIGSYYIRAYTNYQLNFDSDFIFQKPIEIVPWRAIEQESKTQELNLLDFQLFPEGGELIENTLSMVAFKVVDPEGYGINLKGEIRNVAGETITSFETEHAGMGKFQITPEPGEKYVAHFRIKDIEFTEPLPMAQPEGYQLSIRQTSTKSYVTVRPSPGLDMKDCYVLGHVRGEIYVVLPPVKDGSFIYGAIPSEKLPNGVMHYTLFKKELPLAERLVYNHNELLLPTLEISSQGEMKTRQKVQFDFQLPYESIDSIAGKVSVSVLKEEIPQNVLDIRSYLLLASDLKGKIERPGDYFDPDNEDRLSDLDLLMLTQGWRRFKWEEVVEQQLPSIDHYLEKGFSVEGRVVKYLNREKGVKTRVALKFLENLAFHQEVETEEDGTFWFDGLIISDTMTVMVQTIHAKQKDEDELRKDGGTFISFKKQSSIERANNVLNLKVAEPTNDYQEMMAEINRIKMSFSNDVIVLDAFEVNASSDRQTGKYFRPGMLHRDPDARLDLDNITGARAYTNVFQVLRGRVPGVEILGTFPNQKAIIRGYSTIKGNNEAMFLVDGLPTNAQMVSSLDPRQIDFIDVLKGNRSIIYGAEGRGVIAIYLKRGPDQMEDGDATGYSIMNHYGYYPSREFYTPDFENMSAEDAIVPDHRSTQYFSGIVELVDGKGQLNYSTSDDKGPFTMYIEGVTSQGYVIKQTHSFSID
ncbi:MAG: TonB-dependent receptor plug domain-containing protein [Cyclobacteriaceae bacterium]